MRRLVLIEFVQATEKRARGVRMLVDAGSAVSLCDRKKVAVRVGGAPARPVTPPPPLIVPPAPEVEGDDDTDNDEPDAA